MSPSLAQIVKRTSARIVASGALIPRWSTTSAEGTSHDAMTDEWGEGRDRRCPIYAICHEPLAARWSDAAEEAPSRNATSSLRPGSQATGRG